MNGKELTTLLVSLVILILLTIPGAQSAISVIASPVTNLLLPPSTSVNPLGREVEGNVVRFSEEAFRRNLIVRTNDRAVTSGTAVLDDSGALVGSVSSSKKPYTIVQLLSDSQFQAVAETTQGAKGVIIGEINALLFTKIPQNQSLNVGDEVRTSGLDGRFAGGIPIGIIREIYEDNNLLKSAYIEPFADLQNLKNVEFSDE